MSMVSTRRRADVDGGQPPSVLWPDSPGVFLARENRGAYDEAPLQRKAKLFPLTRSSALRPVPHILTTIDVVNFWLFSLTENTLAEGMNLFRGKGADEA